MAQFHENGLIEAKSNGGLIFPSESVIKICEHTELLFKHSLGKVNGMIPWELNFVAVLSSTVLRELLMMEGKFCKLFANLDTHIFDDAADDINHIYFLSKQVCNTYLELRMYAATKTVSESLIENKVRHHLTRQIICQCQ